MSSIPPDPRPTVGRTPLLTLLLAAAAGAAFALVATVIGERLLAGPPSPGPAAVWIALATLVTVLCGARARRRIQIERVPVDPPVATSWLALGKTALIAGALLLGAFAAYAGAAVSHMDTPAGGARFWLSLVAAAAATTLIAAGWWLERNCLIPPASDDEEPPSAR